MAELVSQCDGAASRELLTEVVQFSDNGIMKGAQRRPDLLRIGFELNWVPSDVEVADAKA